MLFAFGAMASEEVDAISPNVHVDNCIVQASDYNEFRNVTDYLNQSDFYFGEYVGSMQGTDFDNTRLQADGMIVLSDVWGERIAVLERPSISSVHTQSILARVREKDARWIAIRRGCIPRVIRTNSLDGQEILRLSKEKFGLPAPSRMFEWR